MVKRTTTKRTTRKTKSENAPDYKLKMKSKTSKGTNYPQSIIGVAWNTGDGEGINIVLNPGVSIDWKDCDNYFFTLWPND